MIKLLVGSILFYLLIELAAGGSNCPYGYSGDNCEDECGLVYEWPDVRTSTIERIVGGVEARPNSWPAAAFIFINYYYVQGDRVLQLSFECGGTLIDRETVLTAAHCILPKTLNAGQYGQVPVNTSKLQPTLESMYQVFLGYQNKKNISSEVKKGLKNSSLYGNPYGVRVGVRKVIQHPNFSRKQLLNDIAILKLDRKVELSKGIQLACLPDPTWGNTYPAPINIPGYVIGWGSLSEDSGFTPDILRNVEITVYNVSECQKYFSVDYSQICAGDLLGNRDSCSGDSGGGMYIFDNFNARSGSSSNRSRFVDVGIVSYGYGCAKPGYSAVYTRISWFLDWIYANI